MLYDAIVIGGSFAGLSGAMQLARGGRNVCVLDGGQPRNRFAAASHGFFGRDGVAPGQMLAEGRAALEKYPRVNFVNSLAVEARGEADSFEVTAASGKLIHGKRLLLAFGVIDSLPELTGLQERWGQTVLHCPYCHGYEVLNQPLGVLSVMPMSTHQALLISDWGPTTFFLNGRARPDDMTCAKLAARGVTVEEQPIVQLEGTTPDLDGVRLADGRLVPIKALFIASRTKVASPIAEQLGCEFDEGPLGLLIRKDAFNQTTVPGVYAAGDITRIGNVTLASAEGVMAGTALHRSLIFDPLEAMFPAEKG